MNGPATSPEIVEACDAAKATIYKYLNELYEENKVVWKPQRGRGKSTYELSDEMKSEIEKKLLKDDVYNLTDFFDVKWLRMLRNLLNNLRKEGIDPYAYFQSNCLTFVGGIPRTFSKSKESMQAIIEWENALENRARKDGITKEEYWRKKLKEAEKLTGVPRILTSLGFKKEEIEELRKRQGGTFKVTRRTRKKN